MKNSCISDHLNHYEQDLMAMDPIIILSISIIVAAVIISRARSGVNATPSFNVSMPAADSNNPDKAAVQTGTQTEIAAEYGEFKPFVMPEPFLLENVPDQFYKDVNTTFVCIPDVIQKPKAETHYGPEGGFGVSTKSADKESIWPDSNIPQIKWTLCVLREGLLVERTIVRDDVYQIMLQNKAA